MSIHAGAHAMSKPTTTESDRTPPETVDAECAHCEEDTPHRVEKGQLVRGGAGVEGTFTCTVCGRTHQGLVEIPVPILIPFRVSAKDRTESKSVEVLTGEMVQVDDEFEVDGALVEVTAVQLKDGRRVARAPAEDIKEIWGKDITRIEVSFAMNVGSETTAFVAEFDPDDMIRIGDVFEYEGRDVEVRKMITNSGRRTHGEYNVRDIKRAWIRPVFEDRQSAPRDPPGPRARAPPRKGAPGSGAGGPPRSGGPPRKRASGDAPRQRSPGGGSAAPRKRSSSGPPRKRTGGSAPRKRTSGGGGGGGGASRGPRGSARGERTPGGARRGPPRGGRRS